MTGTDIAAKIAAHRAKPPSLSRKEKADSREAIKQIAAQHADVAMAKLREMIVAKNTPASARAKAIDLLLERAAGKVGVKEEARPEDDMTRMSEGELIAMICDNIHSLSAQARGAIAEALLMAERNLKLDAEQMARELDEELREEAARAPKPRREPRR